MSFNVLEHEAVPKHEVVPASEKKEILDRFGVDKTQMPAILDSDPALKELKAKPGDLIKITRKSPTAGESVYYRIVVKS